MEMIKEIYCLIFGHRFSDWYVWERVQGCQAPMAVAFDEFRSVERDMRRDCARCGCRQLKPIE